MALVLTGLLFLAPARAQELVYPGKVSLWKEELRPPASTRADRAVWDKAAKWSKLQWALYYSEGEVFARLVGSKGDLPQPCPAFYCRGKNVISGVHFVEVIDGWLSGAAQTELGGELRWYNSDGSKTRQIHHGRIVGMIKTQAHLWALEGAKERGSLGDTLLDITYLGPDKKWQIKPVFQFPQTVFSATVTASGDMIVILADALARYSPVTGEMKMLLKRSSWGPLTPNSCLLSKDEKFLFVGMRQYVIEVNMETYAVRYLIPLKKLQNKLSELEEEQTRLTHGR